MARSKKVELFIEINNEKEFNTVLKNNNSSLICAEVYSEFAGPCSALKRLFLTIKLDWSDGKIILLKVPADEIEVLKRFRDQSEPIYIFIVNRKITKVFRGVDSVRFGEVAKKEIYFFEKTKEGASFGRTLYELDEPTVDEAVRAEVYSEFAGPCSALKRLFLTIKLDWSDGKIILLKVPADEIEVLKRFRDQSEPIYIFIVNRKITKVFRGVDSVRFGEVAKKEIYFFEKTKEGASFGRTLYELDEPTVDEAEWLKRRAEEKKQEVSIQLARQEMRQAARKHHRAELMVPFLKDLNFVLFWHHAKHAHPELYEKWDENNIIMVGREELQLTEEKARDIFYAGDSPLNEASLYSLLSGPALAICFRSLDTDIHFVSLVRKILYEEKPRIEESKPMSDQRPQTTAFDQYKSYSPSREQIWQKRREEKIKLKEETREKRARRLSEMQRLAKQAIEDEIEAKRAAKEQLKLDLLKSAKLDELEKLRQEPDEEINIEIPVALEEEEEVVSEEEDESEYFPPAGLLVPGFYAPPNDIAKANGLAILFPKLVLEHVTPKPEFLPPHVLVLLHMNKRHKAVVAMAQHKHAIIHMGIFKATTPEDAMHIAFTVKQYESMDLSINEDELKLAFMVSIQKDLPLLELMDLNPLYVSRDSSHGELECAAMFKIGYGDDYPQFEDFDDSENK